MIFGRKHKRPDAETPEVAQPEADDDAVDAAEPAESEALDDADEWDEYDVSQDWREDGPFDISEVDLDADEVERLDLGSLVITPFEGMQLQLQVEESSGQVQAIMVRHENSIIEVSLYAAPTAERLVPEARRAMVASTTQSGGNTELAQGPFGTELRRVVPVQGPNGEQLLHVSRIWFVEGPKWLLRGVLLGEAALESSTEGPVEMLYEFFQNLVVRRPDGPLVPGDAIPMTLPADATAS